MVRNVFYAKCAKACHRIADLGMTERDIGVWFDARAGEEYGGHVRKVLRSVLWLGMSLEDVERETGVPPIVSAGMVSRYVDRLPPDA